MGVLKKEMATWRHSLQRIIQEQANWTETEIAWQL
jgi:hypothetical protein